MERGRVDVALSGGVDSSVSAYLLKQAGYQVHALFLYVRPPSFIHCTADEDQLSAMRVAAALGIPFHTIDATAQYTKHVIEPFVEAYRQNQTPNPDILCNKFVKFDVLHDKSDAAFVATGHYARLESDGSSQRLFCGVDPTKDQTYFLWAVENALLSKTLFPIGGMHKKEVRAIAKKARLPSAERTESTGICFIGDVSVRDFLQQYLPVVPGVVWCAEENSAVGSHDGVSFYTLGQRHGFTLHPNYHGPYFVVGKDCDRNIVHVSRTPESFGTCAYQLHDVHWHRRPRDELLFARWRHLQPVVSVALEGTKIHLDTPALIAQGQSLVLYSDQGECLGGGVV